MLLQKILKILNSIIILSNYHYIDFLLEEFYGLEIDNQLILHLKENKCKKIETEYMEDEIKNMINSNLISN